ncbi:MAG: DNA polymerase III subunit beta [Planctomycetota bacterium]|jgi:DNA polymerase-3 subunit beta
MPQFEPSKQLVEAIETEVRERGFRLKHLTRGLSRLSDLFVRNEGPFGEYLHVPEQLAAYTAYYLPVNMLKVRWVLEELAKYAPDFLAAPRRVLDFGSGPGTALLGLGEVSDAPHEAAAVDVVPSALEMAAKLVGTLTRMSIEPSPLIPPGTFDLIFAANVYGELGSDERLDALLEQLDPKGYLVLIEPALMGATRRVMDLRDRLAGAGWKIAAPCLDVPHCPMRAHEDFWCHMDVRWTRPALVQKLDDRVGLAKEALKFQPAPREGEDVGVALRRRAGALPVRAAEAPRRGAQPRLPPRAPRRRARDFRVRAGTAGALRRRRGGARRLKRVFRRGRRNRRERFPASARSAKSAEHFFFEGSGAIIPVSCQQERVMKVSCARGVLHEAFSIASSVVPQRTTIPAIQNVRITATKGKDGGTLELACTDLEFGLRFTVPNAKIVEEGTLVLPASRIAGILRESREDDIALESDGNLAHIRTPGSSFKVVGIDPADFPEMPEFEEKSAVEVGTKNLSEMIRLTAFSVSTEVVRYALTGQLLELKGKEMRMVATDGKRLAFARSESGGKRKGSKTLRVIIPTKTLNLLDRVLDPEDDTVRLNIDETQIRMKTPRALVFSRLIEGNFPDYEAVIPKDRDKTAVLDRADLLSAVRKASLMTTEQTRAVKFQFAKGKLVLFTRAQDVGEATVEIAAQYKGGATDVVFNPDYVVDYLKVLDDETVELRFKDRTSAGVFTAGKDYVYVLMPLTVTL